MKKLTLLVGMLMIAGATFAHEGKSCCKGKGEKCSKEAKCCKDKKNCTHECSKDKKEDKKEDKKA
ncbi:MAG: hypothetical protein WCG87_06840 [Bacteroidota bacterium]